MKTETDYVDLDDIYPQTFIHHLSRWHHHDIEASVSMARTGSTHVFIQVSRVFIDYCVIRFTCSNF